MKYIELLIALLAAFAILYQNEAFLLGFTWAVIHGSGPLSIVALLPLLVAWGVLWFGYMALRRRRRNGGSVAFAMVAILVVLANEALLPATPLSTWRQNRALHQIVVRNVRDEPYRTERGQQIGVRITFDAVFPKTGAYFAFPTALSSDEADVPFDLHFGSMTPVKTSPAWRAGGGDQMFEKGVVYTFTYDLTPNFIEAYGTKPPCVRFVPSERFSEQDFLTTLSRTTERRYTTTIEMSAPGYRGARVQAATYRTTYAYNLHAIYEVVMSSGGGRCRIEPSAVSR